jgi:hypothetical protein
MQQSHSEERALNENRENYVFRNLLLYGSTIILYRLYVGYKELERLQ